MAYIVDFQGFRRPINTLTIKELAIVSLNEIDAVPTVYLFEAPYDWNSLPKNFKSENSWVINNYHGIPWNGGDIPYADLQEVIRCLLHGADKIYVKGLEKKEILGRIVPHVYNLEDLGCPSLSTMQMKYDKCCSHHTQCNFPICAANNIIYLKNWYLSDKKSFDEVD